LPHEPKPQGSKCHATSHGVQLARARRRSPESSPPSPGTFDQTISMLRGRGDRFTKVYTPRSPANHSGREPLRPSRLSRSCLTQIPSSRRAAPQGEPFRCYLDCGLTSKTEMSRLRSRKPHRDGNNGCESIFGASGGPLVCQREARPERQTTREKAGTSAYCESAGRTVQNGSRTFGARGGFSAIPELEECATP